MTISVLAVSIGLRIWGARLQHHLYYIVHALGILIVNTGALVLVSIAGFGSSGTEMNKREGFSDAESNTAACIFDS